MDGLWTGTGRDITQALPENHVAMLRAIFWIDSSARQMNHGCMSGAVHFFSSKIHQTVVFPFVLQLLQVFSLLTLFMRLIPSLSSVYKTFPIIRSFLLGIMLLYRKILSTLIATLALGHFALALNTIALDSAIRSLDKQVKTNDDRAAIAGKATFDCAGLLKLVRTIMVGDPAKRAFEWCSFQLGYEDTMTTLYTQIITS